MQKRTPRPRSARSAADARGEAGGEAGAGLIGTIAGVTVFLAFLLFAVQLLFNLYAASAVTTAAYDAARVVAGSEGGGSTATAETRARQVLGRYADRVTFEWAVDADDVALRVRATNPSFLLPALGGLLGFDEIDRTVRVRVERLR
jgi:hypothetical protein